MTMPKFLNPEAFLTPIEEAEKLFINEMRLWSMRYGILSYLIGMNLGYLSYHTVFKYQRSFVRLPFAFGVFWVARNYFLSKSMDRIFYPLNPIVKKYRERVKKGEDVAQVDTEPAKAHQEIMETQEAQKKPKKLTMEEKEKKYEKKLDEVTHNFHGKYINEEDFSSYDEYQRFLANYIALRYEPLVEEFDEERFFTRESDKKFDSAWRYRLLKKGSPITSISFK